MRNKIVKYSVISLILLTIFFLFTQLTCTKVPGMPYPGQSGYSQTCDCKGYELSLDKGGVDASSNTICLGYPANIERNYFSY